MSTPIETERKFLIRRPDPAALAALPGARVIRIVQTYLTAPAGVTARVRRAEENGGVRWIYTEKRRLSAMSAYEDERELTPEEAFEDKLKRFMKDSDSRISGVKQYADMKKGRRRRG